jgi:predicted Zn-dependent peptidase
MFGGSANIPKYDEPLERVGGENNAFTNNDITNYYLTLPKENLETAFWLESDRMNELAFSKKSFDVQRNVVVEEFRQNYLNQPYGDAWMNLRPLSYRIHPYQWATIGKDPSHIENATMEEVKEFYYRYYNPCNAIMVVAGDVTTSEIRELSEKWFGPIMKGNPIIRDLEMESAQTETREITLERNVPFDAIYKAWHMCARKDPEFYAVDLISDILSAGQSGRLYQELIKKRRLFSELNAFITGDIDEGLFIITGKLMKGVTFDLAEEAIQDELLKIRMNRVSSQELRKVKNRMESLMTFSEMRVLDKAMNLAYYELLGDAGMINTIQDQYEQVTEIEIQEQAQKILIGSNCSTLFYKAL